MKHKTVINLFICFSILLGHMTVRIPPVHAAGTITVNSTSDNTTTDGLCTLREAIINANANFQSRPDCPAGSGADTIIFAESLGFTTIYLGSDLPSITDTTGLTIDGAHRIIIHGSNLYRPFYISFSVPLTLNKIFINNGRNSTSGGGVFVAGGVLTIINSQFNFNHTTAGGSGAALYISNGSAVISNTLFYNNTTNTGIGGAIYLDAGTLNISSSAFLNNSAFIGGAIYANSSIIISNTTFAYNETTISGSGGALSLGPSAAASLYNNTLSQNTAGNIGGGGISINGATANLYNNIVANNSPDDCNKPDPISVITGANNILENDNTISGCQLSPSGNIFSDPNLGAINSGYFPLNPGSPAINAGDDSVCAAAPVNNTSQNGVTRPQGAACDIGAYELPASDPSPTILSITRASTNPTSATSVDFAVVFSEVVTGVDVNDFSISKTGSITDESVTNVSGTGSSYTVTVNTGSGNGTIRLDVPNTATISDLSSNALSGLPFTDGEVYSVDKSGGTLPTSPTFSDVPMKHPYWADIEILYANGFTGGCSASPLLFCPDTTMDRAQGAVFMLRGLVGTSYVPPVEPFANPFGDSWSPGPWAQRWAQGMLDEGLTAGCSVSPLLYCPWEQMPRAQAAVFGMRLLNGSAYLPPAGTGTVFADINGSEWYAGWAEQAYLNGLLPACGMQGSTPLFCPNNLVSRGLGAYMIVRAKNLSMP